MTQSHSVQFTEEMVITRRDYDKSWIVGCYIKRGSTIFLNWNCDTEVKNIQKMHRNKLATRCSWRKFVTPGADPRNFIPTIIKKDFSILQQIYCLEIWYPNCWAYNDTKTRTNRLSRKHQQIDTAYHIMIRTGRHD